jgi:hypothetical protein
MANFRSRTSPFNVDLRISLGSTVRSGAFTESARVSGDARRLVTGSSPMRLESSFPDGIDPPQREMTRGRHSAIG